MVGSHELLAAARANAAPLQRLARAMKVGKEEIAGLVAAVERYVALDHVTVAAEWDATVAMWVEGLDGIEGVQARRVGVNEAGQPVPRLEITLDARVAAADVVERLWDDNPRVAVLAGLENRVYVTPDTLVRDEAVLVLERLHAVLLGSRDGRRDR
jgi:L-seryl-tRNA(Ser) seleniumtransferase